MSVGFLFSAPAPAKALLDPVPMPTTDIQQAIWNKVKDVYARVKVSLVQAGVTALLNAAQSFTQKLAYDTAVYVASGGSGQKPLFDGKSFGDYMKDTALSGAMTFITNVSDKTLGQYGFNVCAPSISLIGKIKVGALGDIPGGNGALAKPRCDWGTFTKSWDKFGSSIGSGEVLKNFGVMFEPGQNELSFAFQFNNKIIGDTQDKLSTAIAQRTSSGGWQDVKNIVTGKVTTPNDIIKDWQKDISMVEPQDQQQYVMDSARETLKEGGWAILQTALSTFTNSLLSQSLKRAMTGLFPGDLFSDQNNPSNPDNANLPVGLAVGRRVAEQVYSDLIKPKILTSSNYDPLSDFTACPDEKDKQINNCVMDEGFASAVRQADSGKPLTVAEAIAAGYLDGGKMLIDSKDASNEQNNCYQNAYCYSNLVKLRKARVLPTGWELAADSNVNVPRATLNEIVKGFNDCNATGARDNAHLWCHLVDPDWVLRLPKTQCNAMVYGPTLASTEGNIRTQICADPISCLSQDENGNCTGGYGYCTKEKNIWRIAADTCSEQFNTCLSYQSRDNKPSNYLRNTVDFGVCDATNVGCRPYSNNQKLGNWILSSGDAVYLNKNAEKCDASAAGCTEFYPKAGGLAYNLLPNPSFEKVDASGGAVGWTNSNLDTSGTNAFDGRNSAKLGAGLIGSPSIKLSLNTAYTFSAYVKGGDYAAYLIFTDQLGAIFDAGNIIATCEPGKFFTNNILQIKGNALADYSRVQCSFLTPNQQLSVAIGIGGSSWLDAAQLEEGSTATAFLSSGYGRVDSVFIKAAPKYLNCQAGSTDSQCATYAPICKAEEVGCERYTPAVGGPSIAGVANVNDVCPAVCAGYETYRQEATLFETEKFPLYFIPASTSTKVCAALDAGCDEFTNLATEAKEYFSFVRQCIKLDPKDQWDTFYTWEGSDTTGYQLRAHRLKIGTVQPGETGPVPDFVPASVANPNPCDKTIFTAKIGDLNYNPDCREFYNAGGQVSYRLLSKTIIATDECTDYRKTDSNSADCVNSGGTWNDTAQYCIYHGYKTDSRVCAATSNKCRAYTGSAASNLRIVFQDDFESGDGGWTGGAVSSESLNAGGHSYKVSSGAGIAKNLTGQISPSQSYSISFWAKGNGNENVQVAMSDATHGGAAASFFTIILKGDWQYYQLGPINTKQAISSASSLQIKLTIGAGFYIDNIVLTEASQKLYLIKDSWTTPAVCDQTINGLLLPQAMLGCKAYNNRSNETSYLKSFGSLCRDEAVGCAAFVDTKNSASDKNEIWNAICALNHKVVSGSEECKYNGQTVCSVGAGNAICRFKITDGAMPENSYLQSDYKDFDAFQAKVRADAPAGGYLIARDESTLAVPADETVYLVDDKKYECKEKDVTCGVLGQSDLYTGGNPVSVYYKNNPADYSQILCTAEAQGCESWTSDRGADYFKVPKSTCEYKDAGGGETGGWYKSGKSEACYNGLIQNGVNGIWRNADAGYNGSVGTCPQAQNECTEFVDPWDTSGAKKSGRPYYLIDNEKLKGLEKDPSCNGVASLESGCVLFNKTSDINLKWNAFATYFASETQKKSVAPIGQLSFCGILPAAWGWLSVDPFKPCNADSQCPANLTPIIQPAISYVGVYTGKCANIPMDTNTILKVTRDRECGQWLSCKSSYMATDPITQKTRPVCAQLGLCDKAQAGSGGSTLCANFVTTNPDDGNVLSADYYSTRDTTWKGKDYSGFSIGGKYPISNIGTVDLNYASPGNPDIRLYVPGNTPPGNCGSPAACANMAATLYGYNLDGSKFSPVAAEKSICRGYPEQDSPYPASVAKYDLNGRLLQVNAGFQNANICENGKNCECDYTKLTYGGAATKKYTEYGNRSVPAGICQGGSREGLPCVSGATFENDPKNSCGAPEEGGTCLKLQRQDDVIGLQGYCLERDLSTPINGDKNQKACLTWLPQDTTPGQRDIYNQFRTAGYVPPLGGGKYYCLQASGNLNAVSVNKISKYANQLIVQSNSTAQEPADGIYRYNSTLIPAVNFAVRDEELNVKPTWKNIIVGTGATPVGGCYISKYPPYFNYCLPPDTDPSRDISNDPLTVVTQVPLIGAVSTSFTKSERTLFIANITDSGAENDKGGAALALFDHPRVAVGTMPTVSAGSVVAGHNDVIGKDVYKDEIDKVEIKVQPDSFAMGQMSPGTAFYIRNGQKNTDYMALGGPCDETNKTDNCSGEIDSTSYLKGQEKAKSLILGDDWYFRYDSGTGEKDNQDFVNIDLFAHTDDLSGFCRQFNTTGQFRQYSYALKFHFDDKGLLESLGVAACTPGAQYEAQNGVNLVIYIHKRETCDVVVDVASSKNMADTQKIWAGNPGNKPDANGNFNTGITGGYYSYNYEVQPFGSSNQDVAPSNNRWYSYYTVGRHNFAGVPWACTGRCGAPLKSDNDLTTIDFEPTPKDKITINLADLISKKTVNENYFGNSLGNLFAKTFKSYTWVDAVTGYRENICTTGSALPGCFDLSSSIIDLPAIYPFTSAGKLTQPNAVAINGAVSQNISVKGSQYQAVMRFYAWANSKHMPLTSIVVNWGDGSIVTTTDGMYKNHKLRCSKTDNEVPKTCFSGISAADPNATRLEIICNSNADCPVGSCGDSSAPFFGNSPGACEENYFEFQHTYTCGNPSGQPPSCSYPSPTVKAIDNWGGSTTVNYGGTITLTP